MLVAHVPVVSTLLRIDRLSFWFALLDHMLLYMKTKAPISPIQDCLHEWEAVSRVHMEKTKMKPKYSILHPKLASMKSKHRDSSCNILHCLQFCYVSQLTLS